MEKRSNLSLKNLIDIQKWQKIQDNFSNVTEVNLRIVSPEGKPITSPSKTPRLCSELLKNCGPCLPTFLGGKGIVDKNLGFSCSSGLYNFATPLRLNDGKILGYVILGPVILVMRKTKEEYLRIAEKLNFEAEDFLSAIVEVRVISYHGMQSLIELFKDIGEYTINLAYKNLIQEREVAIAFDSPKLNRILDVLLDVAFEVSRADIGSVMFFDNKEENITIRSARGIPDDIVRDTRVRVGDGISGIAVKEGSSFLINDNNIADNRIKPYLNRPQLGSSMVLPVKIENRVMGVMNLGAFKTSPVRFNTDNLNLINRLINLATIAIH